MHYYVCFPILVLIIVIESYVSASIKQFYYTNLNEPLESNFVPLCENCGNSRVIVPNTYGAPTFDNSLSPQTELDMIQNFYSNPMQMQYPAIDNYNYLNDFYKPKPVITKTTTKITTKTLPKTSTPIKETTTAASQSTSPLCITEQSTSTSTSSPSSSTTTEGTTTATIKRTCPYANKNNNEQIPQINSVKIDKMDEINKIQMHMIMDILRHLYDKKRTQKY